MDASGKACRDDVDFCNADAACKGASKAQKGQTRVSASRNAYMLVYKRVGSGAAASLGGADVRGGEPGPRAGGLCTLS